MDTKRLIYGMVVAMAIVLGWQMIVGQLAKKYNWDLTGQATQQVAATLPAAPAPAGTMLGSPTTTPVNGASVSAGMRVLNAAERGEAALLGSAKADDPTWSLGLEAVARGAAIGEITLNQFSKSVKTPGRYVFEQPGSLGGLPSMATASVKVNGEIVDLSNVSWQLVSKSASEAQYQVQIGVTTPMLRVVKTLRVYPREEGGKAAAHGGYEVLVGHKLENLAGKPLTVQLVFAGPTPPPREVDRGPDRYVMAGYNSDANRPLLKPEAWPMESLTGVKQQMTITRSEKGWPMIWAGMASTYFDALVLPVGKDNRGTAEFIESVQVNSFTNPQAPTEMSAEIRFQTVAQTLEGEGKSAEYNVQAFFGPKARAVVKNPYYSAYPRDYGVTLSTTGSCSYCTIQWLVDTMVWMLRAFHYVLRDWGLAIIALVLVVRLVMHPMTRKSTISMHKMSKLAPEMERLKKKYADSPDELNKAMMQFYKEHGASQVMGCLPMFLQMPIWIALWSSLQSTFELRQAPFLYGYTWIHDLAKPDQLITFSQPISLWFFTLDGINVLPLAMAVVFWLQQRFTPRPPASTPEQEQQQKMMQWMTLLFPVMLYTGPAGLNLYIFTSTAIGMLEAKMIRDHIKARELATAAAGPVIIDVTATRANRRSRDGKAGEPEVVQGGLRGFFAKLQKMAEEAQKNSGKKK